MEQISVDDFFKVEIRIGTIKAAEIPEGSVKVLKLLVDFGEHGERTIFSGIKEWYEPVDLVGRQVPFVVNLPPKRMGTLGESQGMIMAASATNHEGAHDVVLLAVDKPVPAGTQVL